MDGDLQGNPNHQTFKIDNNNNKDHKRIYVTLITRKQEKGVKTGQAVHAHYATLGLPIYCQCRAST